MTAKKPQFVSVSGPRIPELFSDLIGGRADFFQNYWKKRPMLTKGALASYDFDYTETDFLNDTRHAGAYAVGAVEGGKMSHDVKAADAFLESRAVVMVNIASVDPARRPPRFRQYMELYAGLARHLGISYVQPTDYVCSIFLSHDQSCMGGHYDHGDAFCINLFGSKRWKVERRANPSRGIELQVGGYNSFGDIAFEAEPEEFVLQPGDCLYLPAWCLHRVEGIGPSMGLTLGYRAISELDIVSELVRSRLEAMRRNHLPLMTYPPFEKELYAESQKQLKAKVATVLQNLVSNTGNATKS